MAQPPPSLGEQQPSDPEQPAGVLPVWRWLGGLVGGIVALVGGGLCLQLQAPGLAAGQVGPERGILLLVGWLLAVAAGAGLGFGLGALLDRMLARRAGG